MFKLHDHHRRFAVIGAGGAAGLATLKSFSGELKGHISAGCCEIVGFEQRSDLGGIWLPDTCPSAGSKWPSSPLYNSLKTNIPHPIMLYPSHPAPPSTPLLTSARFVNDYLQSYADRFDLRQYIRFNSRVISSTWDSSTSQWKVVHQSTIDNNHITEHVSFFDHLLVASGHYQHPFVPQVNGLEAWASSESRSYTHSIWYRSPEPYRGLSVLVVGGGRSGVDISEEISKVSNRTVHSVRSLNDQVLQHITQRGAISHFSSEGFVSFVDGRREYIDRVIFATGYQYDYSFLTQLPVQAPALSSDHLYNSGFHIFPLALHTFPLRAVFPPRSLAFIGISTGLSLFELAEVQSVLAIRFMSGTVSLDLDHELSEALKWNERLRSEHEDCALRVAKAWHRLHGDWYDFLDSLFERANDTGRAPVWKRELQNQRLAFLSGSKKLERLGLSESWAQGVGEGGTQEWADLIWRVIAYAKAGQHGDTAPNASIL